jgi:hypothetical protein
MGADLSSIPSIAEGRKGGKKGEGRTVKRKAALV